MNKDFDKIEQEVKDLGLDYWVYPDPEDYAEAMEYYASKDVPGIPMVTLNMNDMFYWGSSDSEEVLLEDLPALRTAVENAGSRYGDLLFAARKRNLRPQGVVLNNIKSKTVRDLFLDLPEREVDLCNPYNTEGEYKYVRESQ